MSPSFPTDIIEVPTSSGKRLLRGVEVRGGLICWDWERGDVEMHEIRGSHFY